MSDEVTTSEVRSIISATIPQAEMQTSDLAEGVRVTVPDQQVGRFYGVLRREGLMDRSSSKRLGDNLVSHIEAEESKGLGELFG